MSKYFFHITNHEIEMIYHADECAWIPPDPANMDYQAYLLWLEEGNTPEPWEPES